MLSYWALFKPWTCRTKSNSSDMTHPVTEPEQDHTSDSITDSLSYLYCCFITQVRSSQEKLKLSGVYNLYNEPHPPFLVPPYEWGDTPILTKEEGKRWKTPQKQLNHRVHRFQWQNIWSKQDTGLRISWPVGTEQQPGGGPGASGLTPQWRHALLVQSM